MDNYSGLNNVAMWQLFNEVYDMDDDYLVEEVLNLNYTKQPHVESIINKYMLNGRISQKEREELIGYYILVWHDGDLED